VEQWQPVVSKQALSKLVTKFKSSVLARKGKKSVVTGVEMFRKILDEWSSRDNVGLLLRGIDKDEIKRGMVIAHRGK
jgi:translation elongation factor EF-Tu-like GTPase